MPTRAEYEAAKQHQRDNPELYAAADPTAEVIANVTIINAYEGGRCLTGPAPVPGTPGTGCVPAPTPWRTTSTGSAQRRQ